MNKLFLIACAIFIVAGCNNNAPTTDSNANDSTKMADAKIDEKKVPKPEDYPYKLDRPYADWQPGDQQHAINVMKMIKAWETKNLKECVSFFGDSVDMRLDMYQKVVPHDSLINVLNMSWADMTSVTVKMQDWESVISKDKKEEWVTLWYKQTWVNTRGKADSLSVVNDAKIFNGKIVVFDEKIQHYPAAKK